MTGAFNFLWGEAGNCFAHHRVVSVHQNEPAGSPQRTVLVASESLLAAWSAFGSWAHEVIAVSQADGVAALDMIRRRRPAVVVLEEAFAASARGAALVTRLQTDTEFRGLEIRLLSAERVATLQSSHAAHAHTPVSLAALARPVPSRHAVRIQPASPVDIRIDGNPATLVDLSALGAQVCSSLVLRPQQRVRVVFPLDTGAVRMTGTVLWSVLETGARPAYRAGIRFMPAFPLPVDEILSRLAASHIVH
jgi:hypothetical protein